MPICWMIRKASPSVVPLAFRAIGSSSTTLNPSFFASRSPRNQTHRLSSIAADKDSVISNLLEALNQEIKSTKSCIKNFNVTSPNHALPFEIEVNEYERELKLTRKYPDDEEEVLITINMSNVNTKGIDSYYESHFGDDYSEESKNGSCKEDIRALATPIPMQVEVKKTWEVKVQRIFGWKRLKFDIVVSTDGISIKDYSITNDRNDKFRSCQYTGPILHGRLDKLQPYINKYLEIRGINNSTASFLLKYIAKKKKEIDLKTLIHIEKATCK